MKAAWPVAAAEPQEDATAGVDALIRLVTAVRNFRSTRGVPFKSTLDLRLQPKEHSGVFDECRGVVAHLSNVRWVDTDIEGDVLTDVAYEAVVRS